MLAQPPVAQGEVAEGTSSAVMLGTAAVVSLHQRA